MYGVYVHVPWCRVRCPYCAFAVDTRREPDEAGWVAGVLRDWAREAPFFVGAPTTLAFGGGTPSRADPASLAAVVRAVAPSGEVSMEANPEDVTPERLAAWRGLGVTRLSLGVQTFSPALAPRLGRAHSARQAVAALGEAIAAGFRSVSADLIFGQAGQEVAAILDDVEAAVAAGVGHVSLYALTIEEGTPFAARAGMAVDEDRWVELQEAAVRRLGALGFEQYEVSNFARLGHRSQHNEHYWRARSWAGLGPSAHGWRPDGTRTANPSGFGEWSEGQPPECERPTPQALLFELVWSTLRHVEGVDGPELAARTGFTLRAPPRLLEVGLLRWEGHRLCLAPTAFPISDGVVRAVVDATLA